MLSKLKQLSKLLKGEVEVYQRILRHAETPGPAKWALGLAIGYLFMPFDLVPDWIPVLGQLDDVLIVGGLLWIALKIVPPHVVEACRQ
jgi:uncharacterized membrane protein YkvA (DUF1232 family)